MEIETHTDEIDSALLQRCVERVVVQGKLAIHDVSAVTWRRAFDDYGMALKLMEPLNEGAAGIKFKVFDHSTYSCNNFNKATSRLGHVRCSSIDILEAVIKKDANNFKVSVDYDFYGSIQVVFQLTRC